MTGRVIDSHHHFWNPASRVYPWMEGLTPLQRVFAPDDLRPLIAAAGVDAVVTVQTVADVAETVEFLETAAATDFVAGVVGWVDLTDPAVGETLAALQARPDGRYLVGIRHQVHDEADVDWLRRPDVQRGIRAVGAAGLVYDLLLKPPYIDAAVACAAALPEVRFVVDHIAKPEIARGEIADWAAKMTPFAGMPHVACKLSGMVTEADWTHWTPADLRPYVEKVVGWFGEDRLLYGSDWPVCTLAGGYVQVKQALETALGPIEVGARDKIFGANAERWYRLLA